MSEEKYIDEKGFFVGEWTAQDAEEYFSKPENQVKKLVINQAFSDLSWIRHLKEIESLAVGHYSGFPTFDTVLDLGLLPHNPNRKKLKISFECKLKSLLNWHKTDATDLNFSELWLGEDAYDLGFVEEPEEPWGHNVQSIWIFEQRARINLKNFQDGNLKRYHDEQYYYSRDNIELDYFGSCGVVSSLEKLN